MPLSDAFDRTPISDAMRARVDLALAYIEPGKRGALLIIADEHGTRAQVAANLDDAGNWKVAAGGGWLWAEKKPFGFVGIEGSW